MQTFKLNPTQLGTSIVGPNDSDAGIITYVIQSIMTEYDSLGNDVIEPQNKRRCGLLTFGPCDSLLDTDGIITQVFGSSNPVAPDIVVYGDSATNNPQYQEYRFPITCSNSVYVPPGTSTATSTASA
jgi:hypothetical protein